jgi:protein SCO1
MSVLSVLIFSGIYTLLQPQKTLPIFTPRDVNPELVDTTIQHIGYNHTVADFKFVNQNGKTITEKDYEGKIYVADFFFTTCPTICPIMTDNMVWLQNEIKNMPNVLLLSHTVTPDIDSVPVLKAMPKRKVF